MNRILVTSVVDPGISRGRGANSKGGCEKLLFGHFFPKKLYEIERIWTPKGTRVPSAPRSANAQCHIFVFMCVLEMCYWVINHVKIFVHTKRTVKMMSVRAYSHQEKVRAKKDHQHKQKHQRINDKHQEKLWFRFHFCLLWMDFNNYVTTNFQGTCTIHTNLPTVVTWNYQCERTFNEKV